MIIRSDLLRIIEDQQQAFQRKGMVERIAKIPEGSNRIVIVTGIRRCGKSTLARQLFIPSADALYINFEDPRLIEFDLQDFERLESVFIEKSKSHLILDEVQNIPDWERYARIAHEKGISLIITGSNASMLSRELGTRLTGRYMQMELFPFNYHEFLQFFDLMAGVESLDKFLEMGGFPEFLAEPDTDYHRTLLRDILTRDIAVRRNITNEQQLMRLAVHLLSNIGKEFSYNRLMKALDFKSVRTVIDYCDYMTESYVIGIIPLFSNSASKQAVNPKKVYCIDTALARSNSLSFSKDWGRRLENMVYCKLRQEFNEIFYFKSDKSECDFVAKNNEAIEVAVQVCWEVNAENIQRELSGLKNAAKQTGAANAIIITYNQEDTLDGVELIPAWKWL